ncbi:MAG: hypothetical protein IH597_12890 [Bacteroidales bacterium]|nr:hypothetical protein [Bacteroidales bacterium]
MKTKMFGLLAMFLAASILVLNGCKKDDEEPPTMVEITVSADNATISVVFSEGVYSMNDKTGALDGDSFDVTITGGVATYGGSYTVQHTAGTAQASINLTLNGVATGQETVTVKPKTASSIYNAAGEAMETTQTLSANLKDTGIIGRWYSSGTNVAVLLAAIGIDSIYAEFKADNTYIVESFTADLSKTTLTGNYVQARSATGNIWDITVNQNTPNSLTSVGIFEVTSGAQTTMKYEVAQTEPNIPGVTPPTAAAGFGSTSAGAYQNWNVQTYIKMN